MRLVRRVCAPLFLCVAAFVSGCQHQPLQQQITEFNRDLHQPRILVMPVDIELSELTAAGLQEPKAEWTAAAKANVIDVLREEQTARGNGMVEYDENTDTQLEEDVFHELSKLHGVIGNTIAIHSLTNTRLPNKNGKFDWTLGPDVQKLARRYDADYALFIYVRDSYASAGRVAVIIFAAIMRYGVQGGTQVGYASLVDLKTGDIVWFNRLARASGDLRTKGPAQETVRTLLNGLPR